MDALASVLSSIGNHDDEINHASAYRDVFVLPDRRIDDMPDNAERYYSFNYGPIHFVALDTESALLDADGCKRS